MIPLCLEYAAPSAVECDRERARLDLSADAGRPVCFQARVVRHALSLRFALQALGNVLVSASSWRNAYDDDHDTADNLDPVVTVHPDRVFFEAFSQDRSAYALVVADRQLFEPQDAVAYGSTNVDFTFTLASALADMRSGRDTWLCIKAEGAGSRFERRVELEEAWVRGFLQLQEAMALPGTRITCRPVDILAAIRFLGFSRAKVAPRALRYEFDPEQPARLVLEPWEQTFTLKGTEHNYAERRIIRTWGRNRLRLIEPLLPYAEHVDVYLKGRARPSFYAVRLPGVTFLLGLTGWTDQRWTGTGNFADLSSSANEDAPLLASALERLREATTLRPERLAEALNVTPEVATRLLVRLCRQGKVHYDIETFTYRHRELFPEPIDEARVFPPNPQQERARRLLEGGTVTVSSCEPRETRKQRKYRLPSGESLTKEVIYRDWQVKGSAGEESSVEVIVNDVGRVLFGKCGCRHFRDHMLNQGPCQHLIALLCASESMRKDMPTSVPASSKPATSLDTKADSG